MTKEEYEIKLKNDYQNVLNTFKEICNLILKTDDIDKYIDQSLDELKTIRNYIKFSDFQKIFMNEVNEYNKKATKKIDLNKIVEIMQKLN